MSKRNGKINLNDYYTSQNNIKLFTMHSKEDNNKMKNNINSQINKIKIELRNMNKFHKFFSPCSFNNEKKSYIDNLKKINYSKINNDRNRNISKNSSKNARSKSSKRDKKSKTKFYDYSGKLNDSLLKYERKRNNSLLRKRYGSKKSPTQKMIRYNPSFFTRTPKCSRSRKTSKSSKSKSSQNNLLKYNEENDYSLIIYKNKIKNKKNKSKKKSFNTEIKKESKCFIRQISKKKTIALNNIMINKPLYRATSCYSQKNINNKNNNNIKELSKIKKKKGIDNYISKRNIYINLNNENLPYKKYFFSTENNTNTNTNYNSNNNSNNETLKIKNINKVKNDINNATKAHQNGKSFFSPNDKKLIGKIERKKLSFDVLDNNNNKNLNKNNLRNICNNKTNSQTNQNCLIIRFENKQLKNYFQKNNNNDKKEELTNSDDNGYQFITESEQGVNAGINSVKTNNFIINKPKEENLKYSSIKEFMDENEDATEISPSQISKIIIGQIEGYKDILEDDKNINSIADKSKSILELLSKLGNKYNNHYIDNLDNLYFFEESNAIREMNENNNSRNIPSDTNMPNLTNIKNVDEDYDSEDLSLSVFKNNIKSINTQSKVYLNKIFANKSKNNFHLKNFAKNSVNTNNTTISSGHNINKDNNNINKDNNNNLNKDNNNINKGNSNNINKDNNINAYIKSKKEINNNDYKNNIFKFNSQKTNMKKKISPSSSARYNLNNFKNIKSNDKTKKNKSIVNRNDKKMIYIKHINKSKIIKNCEVTKRLNSIKSCVNIYKNLDTNVIFNSNKKGKKKIIKNIDQLLKEQLLDERNNMELKDEENNETKKIVNYNIPVIDFLGENETIINAYFNDIDNENDDKNETTCNKSENDKNENNNKQCFIF